LTHIPTLLYHAPLFTSPSLFFLFFFNDTATTEIYTLSLHDALPIFDSLRTQIYANWRLVLVAEPKALADTGLRRALDSIAGRVEDRKSTRLNSSHSQISYAVFCLKKKKKNNMAHDTTADLKLPLP